MPTCPAHLSVLVALLLPLAAVVSASGQQPAGGPPILDFNLDGGVVITIQTAEATSSVMLWDKAGKMEYAD